MSQTSVQTSIRTSFDLSAYFVVGLDDTKGRPLIHVVNQALAGGITFLQLRAKHADAQELTEMARDLAQCIADYGKSDSVAFVINDRVDVAWQCRKEGIKVDGVHIGQTDMNPVYARELLGDDAIIGLSAESRHLIKLSNSLPLGCIDYIGAGPFHPSTTKPEAVVRDQDGTRHYMTLDFVNQLCAASRYPVVVGGGLTLDDIGSLASTAAQGWFVVSAIAGADDPQQAAYALRQAWSQVRGHQQLDYPYHTFYTHRSDHILTKPNNSLFVSENSQDFQASETPETARTSIAPHDSPVAHSSCTTQSSTVHHAQPSCAFTLPIVLTIAGSDSSGGAGIQADIKTITLCGAYAMSAITAVTAQNTMEVRTSLALEAHLVTAQIATVCDDMMPQAVKIGMMPTSATVSAVAAVLREYDVPNIVVDPVMIASSGAMLSDERAVSALCDELFNIATLITPNIPEAETLLGWQRGFIRTRSDMEQAAHELFHRYGCNVLVKGGHLGPANRADSVVDDTQVDKRDSQQTGHESIEQANRQLKRDDSNQIRADDVAVIEGQAHWFSASRVITNNTHGTGCTLSSAIATYLAQGNGLLHSIEQAKRYLHGAMSSGLSLGHGSGPLDHCWQSRC